ncbi:O-antigen ligase family protein [Aetokthonos hydrillicola Thurmond2011]|jgi:O-antigen ligase|uniref:O-antigen ligase family protein n=1 Tax=Aetokthonos hydrillicola Thurmond2011 TaxID=2712845 RepID=A0AAP5I1I5_9CYAN|nr:O-antigen ligase family protein [Aetokthonos hydrillicola]MBO3462616.1 O-antigen ligase family protein [Aetokthonos hydrillicola CCALA 1050]MBW4588108.1 O-antigen ligase family protein [Aetokthonos hydrillicola CCALA 1050]MDR9893423.1 O-antigen ligase family protein [Aetokthonos hydrillicola Thurmond2011]
MQQITIKKLLFSQHPDPRLQFPWNLVQLGLVVFPLSPLLGLVGLIAAVIVTWLRRYEAIIRRRQILGFALLSVLLIITSCFAYDKKESFIGLSNFVPYFVVFGAYSTLIQTMRQLRQLSWIMVVMSVPVIIIGFGQLFLGWASSKQLESFLSVFGWVVLSGGNPPGRMASVFMYANTLAGYLLIVFILGFGLWLESYQQLRANKKFREISSLFPFLFLTMAVIGDFVGLILTDSRNAWAIAIFACLVYAIYQGWRILVAGVAGVVATVLLAAFAPLPIAQLFRKVVPVFFWARLNDQLYPNRAVGSLRATQWDFAWALTLQRPLTGWGLRNFTPLYLARTHEWLGHPHNLFLMLSCETGLINTVLFCSLIGWIFIGGVKLFQKLNVETEDKLILFSYLLIVVSLVLFNTVDVSLYDVRLNSLSWIVVSAIAGVTYCYNRRESLSSTTK